MIEIRATQAKRVFTFHEEEIALPQLLSTRRTLGIAQDGKDNEFFGLQRGSDVASSYGHASAAQLLRLLQIRQIRTEGRTSAAIVNAGSAPGPATDDRSS